MGWRLVAVLAWSMCAAMMLAEPVRGQAPAAPSRDYLLGAPRNALTFYGGWSTPSANSGLWDFTFQQLTLDRDGFGGLHPAVDYAVRVGDRTDLVFHAAWLTGKSLSEFRDFVGTDDLPIQQVSELRRVPVGASLRYYLRPRGESFGKFAWVPTTVVPYVALGGGLMWFRFIQDGEWVDTETLDIFASRFIGEGQAGFLQGTVGGAWAVRPGLAITAELRYLRASGEASPSFVGFDRLDLSGLSTQVGLTIRY